MSKPTKVTQYAKLGPQIGRAAPLPVLANSDKMSDQLGVNGFLAVRGPALGTLAATITQAPGNSTVTPDQIVSGFISVPDDEGNAIILPTAAQIVRFLTSSTCSPQVPQVRMDAATVLPAQVATSVPLLYSYFDCSFRGSLALDVVANSGLLYHLNSANADAPFPVAVVGPAVLRFVITDARPGSEKIEIYPL